MSNSPLHPVPFRQPSYSEAQRRFPLSPPLSNGGSQTNGAQTPAEADDGGWGVDADQTPYLKKMRKRRERNFQNSFPDHDDDYYNTTAPKSTEEDRASLSLESKDQAQDPSLRTDDNEVQNQDEEKQLQEVLAPGSIKTEVDTMTTEKDTDLVNSLTHLGFHVGPDKLSQLMALLGQPKSTVTHPVQTTSAEAPVPPTVAPTPITPTVAGLGQEYPGKAAVANFGRQTRDFQCNTTPLPTNRWGGPPRGSSPAVPNPQVPTTAQALAEAYAADVNNASDGGWTPHDKCRDWARDVTPSTPPGRSPPPSPPSLTRSVHTPAREVTVDVVDEEDSDADTDLPTPGKVDQSSPRSAVDDNAPSPVPIVPAPTSSAQRTEYRGTFESADGEDRRRPRMEKSQWETSGLKWKRDPHPAFSPLFLSRRVLITFPDYVHVAISKPAIYEHFDKYGSIRMVWFHNQHGRECKEYILVFDYEDSVESCLADPSRTDLYLQTPEGGHDYIKIEVELAPRYLTTKTIYIKITGPRHDARSRSASPRRGDRTEFPGSRYGRDLDFNLKPLPARIYIDAIPSRRRFDDLILWWARVREQNVPFETINRRAQMGTEGSKSYHIDSFELGRRVPDKDIIPVLCGYFAELVEVVPPIDDNGGWLIGLGGAAEVYNVLSELHKIPGITSRWASEADGPLRRPAPVESYKEFIEAPKLDGKPATSDIAATSLENGHSQADGAVDQTLPAEVSNIEQHDHATLTTEVISSVNNSTAHHGQSTSLPPLHDHYSPVNSTHSDTQTLPPLPTQVQTPPQHAIDPRYPHLRKVIVPTYRGRTLREDLSEDTPRYFDDAAVFAGRLVKEMETEQSLHHRFSRYGQICAIEYNPRVVTTTYATARILYSQRAAAERALKYEQGAVSFGSMLKIDRRRVLSTDVNLEERYIDDWGRAYSPSMVSQYSPPQHPIEDEMLFTQPPPLNTGPAIIGNSPFMQWIPYPLPPLPPLPTVAPMSPEQVHSQGMYNGPTIPIDRNGGQANQGDQGPPPNLLPMIYSMGLVYHPPPGYSGHPPPQIPENGILPTPPITPFMGIFPFNGIPTLPISSVSASQTQNQNGSTVPYPTSVLHRQDDPTISNETLDSGRKRSPKVTGTKMENGVLKIIYDDEDMKRYRRETGMPEIEPQIQTQDQVVEEIGLSGTSSISVNTGSISATSIDDRTSAGYRVESKQRINEPPNPFSPPRAPHPGMTMDPARFSPEVLFRPFNHSQSPSHGHSSENGSGRWTGSGDGKQGGFGNGQVRGREGYDRPLQRQGQAVDNGHNQVRGQGGNESWSRGFGGQGSPGHYNHE